MNACLMVKIFKLEHGFCFKMIRKAVKSIIIYMENTSKIDKGEFNL